MDPRSKIAAINKLLSTIREIHPQIEPHQI
jgi:hypothetical protein